MNPLNSLNLTNLLSSGNNIFPNMSLLGSFNNIMNTTNSLSNRNNSPSLSKSPSSKRKNNQNNDEDETSNDKNSSAQQRRVPVRFTADQKRLLYQLFEVNRYPKKPEREEIASKIGVPEYAVHNFFSNTRKAIYRAAAATPGGQASLSDLTSVPGIVGSGDAGGVGLSESLANLTGDLKADNEE